jgi:hypothetical protein
MLLCLIAFWGSALMAGSSISSSAQLAALSARQQQLSQRIAKSLFAIGDDQTRKYPPRMDYAELDFVVQLFDETQDAMMSGGTVHLETQSLPISISPAPAQARTTLVKTQELWDGLLEKINPILKTERQGQIVSDGDLADALNAARLANLKLRQYCQTLTVLFQNEAQHAQDVERTVQFALTLLLALSALAMIYGAFERKSIKSKG